MSKFFIAAVAALVFYSIPTPGYSSDYAVLKAMGAIGDQAETCDERFDRCLEEQEQCLEDAQRVFDSCKYIAERARQRGYDRCERIKDEQARDACYDDVDSKHEEAITKCEKQLDEDELTCQDRFRDCMGFGCLVEHQVAYY